jgi:hypothetical protein
MLQIVKNQNLKIASEQDWFKPSNCGIYKSSFAYHSNAILLLNFSQLMPCTIMKLNVLN